MLGGLISGFLDIVILVIFFSFAVFIHEFGHFLAAVKLGFKVKVFSIGFGPALFKWEKNGIVYKFSMIPFGGYVSLPQLDPSGMEKIQGEDAEESNEEEYGDIAAWKRIIVAFAGPLGNIILATILAFVIYWLPTDIQEQEGAFVGYILEDSPAFAAGVKRGDEIIEVNGRSVKNWNDVLVESLLSSSTTAVVKVKSEGVIKDITIPLSKGPTGDYLLTGVAPDAACVIGAVSEGGSAAKAGLQPGDIIKSFNGELVLDDQKFIEMVASRPDMETEIVVIREDGEKSFMVTPEYNATIDRAIIGIRMGTIASQPMQWMMYKKPGDQLWGDASSILRVLKALVTPKESGKAAKNLGGPVTIIFTLWMVIQDSFLNALGFLRFLNTNLAILNLLPIPVLDGGHIIFALYEVILRRKPSAKVVNTLVNIFAILLICSFIFLTFRDTVRIKQLFWKSKPVAEETK